MFNKIKKSRSSHFLVRCLIILCKLRRYIKIVPAPPWTYEEREMVFFFFRSILRLRKLLPLHTQVGFLHSSGAAQPPIAHKIFIHSYRNTTFFLNSNRHKFLNKLKSNAVELALDPIVHHRESLIASMTLTGRELPSLSIKGIPRNRDHWGEGGGGKNLGKVGGFFFGTQSENLTSIKRSNWYQSIWFLNKRDECFQQTRSFTDKVSYRSPTAGWTVWKS